MKQEINKNNVLVSEIKTLIEQSKQQVSVAVNATITMLYWQVGNRINTEILKEQRAEYGKQIVHTVSAQLTAEYGPGWGEKQLRHCIRFAQAITEKEIVYTLCRQLSWSHIRLVIFMEDELKRQFYLEICKIEKWSVRTFQDKINSMRIPFEECRLEQALTLLSGYSERAR